MGVTQDRFDIGEPTDGDGRFLPSRLLLRGGVQDGAFESGEVVSFGIAGGFPDSASSFLHSLLSL